MRLRRMAQLVGVLTLLSVAATTQGQCLSGADVAICPAADVMYINRNDTLTALSLSRGAVEWHIALPKSDSDFDGPVATADTVAVWAGFPATRVDGFDAATGKHLWTVETSTDDMTALGHYVFVNDAEHWEALTALDGRTGKRVWHHSGTRFSPNGRVRFYASDGRTLLTNFFAIDAQSGLILARWPRRREVSAGVLGDKFAVIGISWAADEPTKIAAYSLSGYETLWVKDDPRKREIRGLAADGNRVFAALYPDASFLEPGEVGLDLLDAASGKTIWSKTIKSDSTLYSAIGLTQGVAVFVTGDSAMSSSVEGFDAATGQSKWRVHVDEKLVGSVLCAGANCYIEAISSPGHVLGVNVQTGAQSWFRIPN